MRLTYRAEENTLRLTLDEEPGFATRRLDLPGFVEVGEGGRLVGVEIVSSGQLSLVNAFGPWLADPIASEYVTVSAESAYIELSTPDETGPHEQVRSAQATLIADLDASGTLVALSIPRRGHGYEISYPSGNR